MSYADECLECSKLEERRRRSRMGATGPLNCDEVERVRTFLEAADDETDCIIIMDTRAVEQIAQANKVRFGHIQPRTMKRLVDMARDAPPPDQERRAE